MSDFKDAQGRWLTRGLILETNYYNDTHALFTLESTPKKRGDKTLLPIRELYLATNDPTEYTFATKHLGGWEHWQAMLKSPVVLAEVEKWRVELEAKVRSEALMQIVEKSQGEKGYQAAKLLLDRGWDIRKAGAPSKEEREGLRKADKAFEETVTRDAERLGIRLIKK